MSFDAKKRNSIPLTDPELNLELRDPKSDMTKYLNNCREEFEIKQAVIMHYFEISTHQKYLTEKQEDVAVQEALEKSLRDAQSIDLIPAPAKTEVEAPSSFVPQGILEKLVTQHANLSSYFSDEVAKQLGSNININGTNLAVPPVFKPAPPISAILKVNPALAAKVTADPQTQAAFATFHTKAETGPFAVFRMYREILAYNNKGDLSFKDKKELMTLIDAKLRSAQVNGVNVINDILSNNKSLLELVSQDLKHKYNLSGAGFFAAPAQANPVSPEKQVLNDGIKQKK